MKSWGCLKNNMDDPNTTQNPISEENSIPASPSSVAEGYGGTQQEPMADAPIPATVSTPAEVPPGATEASGTGFSAESNNIPLSNSTPTEAVNEQKTEERQASSDAESLVDKENEADFELVSEPIEAQKSGTAQISTNEPLIKPEELPPSASLPEKKPPASPELKSQTSTSTEATPSAASSSNHMRELQIKEQLAIKNKKRKKLDLVMTLFLKKSKNGSTSSPQVTNDEVEKFLHVSDATATRYLSQLEKEGKIKQSGKTGKGISYSKL